MSDFDEADSENRENNPPKKINLREFNFAN